MSAHDNHNMMNMDKATMTSMMNSSTHHMVNGTGAGDHSMHMTTMNHGGHGSGNGGGLHDGMGMQMVFTTEWKMTQVLFSGWQLNEVWQLALSCVFLAVLAALYEGLKVLREHLLVDYNRKHNIPPVDQSGSKSGDGSREQVIVDDSSSVSKKMCNWMHFLQTFLHMFQVTMSYFLMLVFMTYNVYLCISVILGAGIGYFLFGWKRAVIIDNNEHCH